MSRLSIRLKTIASLVPHGTRVCDVGTDHAYLPIYLKQSGIASQIIATDLNEKPLKNAKANIATADIDGICLRLCDGLSGISRNEVETIIIAGMGGEVVADILKNCAWIKDKTLNIILQPTTSAELLREFLCKNGFKILKEIPVFENKKLYTVISTKFENDYSEKKVSYWYMGEIPPTEIGILYLKKQQKRAFGCMKALQNVEGKQSEFLLYKSIYEDIEKFITRNTNVI